MAHYLIDPYIYITTKTVTVPGGSFQDLCGVTVFSSFCNYKRQTKLAQVRDMDEQQLSCS